MCQIPHIMMGTFNIPNQQVMNKMVVNAIRNGCYGFDTSPSYGTEHTLGIAIHEALVCEGKKRNDIFISDKIDGIQMYKYKGQISECVKKSLKDVNCEYFDLILIHWPFMEYLENTWYDMAKLKKEGLIKHLGICNITVDKLNEINTLIGENPEFIQNEVSPLNYDIDVDVFKKKKICVEAYSPFARMVRQIKESDILHNIAIKYKKDIGQIILKWHIQRGIIPIFTSTNEKRIISNLQVNDFQLDEDDMEKIKSMDIQYKIFPYSYGCPRY